MSQYIIDNIKKILIDLHFSPIFNIILNDEQIYNNGIDINKVNLKILQEIPNDKNNILMDGIIVDNERFVVVSMEQMESGILFIHFKSKEDGLLSIFGKKYIMTIKYDNEIVPMFYSVKIDNLKKKIPTINSLLK